MKGAESPADDVGPAAMARRARLLGAAVVFAMVFAASPLRARADVLVSLDYQTDAALVNCPSAGDFRQEIVRQIGRDPFRETAARRVLVRLYTIGGRMAGRVEWRDANDQWEGERAFSSRNESCAQMARSMALATAIQIQLVDGLDPMAAAPNPDSKPPPASDTKPVVIVPIVAPAAPSPAPAPRDPYIDVSVGVGVIQDLNDSPVFVVPRLAVSVARASAFRVRLAACGFGPGADVARTGGTAQLERFLMTLELVRFFRVGRAIQPMLAVGGGWQDLRVKGSSAMPTIANAHDGHAFAAVVAGSGGVAFVVATRLSLIVEIETFLYRPSLTVQIASAQAARLGGAAVFAHGGLLARF